MERSGGAGRGLAEVLLRLGNPVITAAARDFCKG